MNINENYNKFSKQDLINIILDKKKLINALQTKINATNKKIYSSNINSYTMS